MIGSFACRDTEALYHSGKRPKRLPPDLAKRAVRKLDMLAAAADLKDLRSPPGNRLEALKGDRAGYYSIRINDQWRVVFSWDGADAHEVEIIDYH